MQYYFKDYPNEDTPSQVVFACLFVCFLYCRPLGNLHFSAACLHFMEHGQLAGTAPTTQWPAYRRHQPWTHPHHAYHLHQEALWCLRVRTNSVMVAQSGKLQPERMKMGRKGSRTGSWQDYQMKPFLINHDAMTRKIVRCFSASL